MRNAFAYVSLALLSVPFWAGVADGQDTNRYQLREQSHFNIEQAYAAEPIERPMAVPERARRVLAESAIVSSCLEGEDIARGHVPSSWFIASEIHLDGRDEVDLVVLPNLNAPKSQAGPGPAACFLGASTGWFWIVRQTPEGYQLVLTVGTHNLEISTTRTNGLRDIVAVTPIKAGAAANRVIYKFHGRKYEKSE